MNKTFEQKLADFAALLQAGQLQALIDNGVDCQPNRDNCRTKVKPGLKYTKVDVGGSGKYMVENSSSIIFGIKGYGVIHRGHSFGTLDTITEWDWRGYRASKLDPREIATGKLGCDALVETVETPVTSAESVALTALVTGVSVQFTRDDVSELYHIVNSRGESKTRAKLLAALLALHPQILK